jgi:hypothetical protein
LVLGLGLYKKAGKQECEQAEVFFHVVIPGLPQRG